MKDVFILTRNGCGLVKNMESLQKEFLRRGMQCRILSSPRTALNTVKECFSLDYKHVPKLRSLKVADFSVDPDTYKIKNGLYGAKLRKKEYELLRFFMSNKNLILSRNTILENVWGDDAPNPFTNTVDVHVSALRKKFKIGDGKDLFKTVHGVGYTMHTY